MRGLCGSRAVRAAGFVMDEDDVFDEDLETPEEKAKREARFAPINNVIEPETPLARQFRLRR